MAALPHYKLPSFSSAEPVYKALFEVDFKDEYMNSVEAVTKIDLENGKVKFTFNDSAELELVKMQEYFDNAEQIHVKQHDKSGAVFRKITLTKKGDYSLAFSLDYSSSDLSEVIYSFDCDYEFKELISYKMNKKFGL